MLTYSPGETVAHCLDPRSKLCFQAGFAIVALAAWSLPSLAAVYVIAGATLLAGRLSPLRVVRAYRIVFVVLAFAPLVAGVTLGAPWFRTGPALASLFAVARVPPVLAISAVYVHTTSSQETRAAVQRVVPGRVGQLLGVGVSLVFRFFPSLVRDLRATRTAMHARAGHRRSVRDRSQRLSVRGLRRAVARADRLATALSARCFAWNPTLPALTFGRFDYAVTVAGLTLAVVPLVRWLA